MKKLTTLLLLILISSCSTERKCRNWQVKGQKLGCLKPDTISVTDTIILIDYDTLVKFDTLNDVDTLIVENGGIKTLVFTKWKTREVMVRQKSDTIFKTRTIPVQKIVKGECDTKPKWWIVLLNIVSLLIGLVIGLSRKK